MKHQNNTNRGAKLSWKKIKKQGNKFREKLGLSSSSSDQGWIKATLQPNDPKAIASFTLCLHFIDKVDQLRKKHNGIPEELDRICIEETGLNLGTFTSFLTELSVRMVMSKQGLFGGNLLGYSDTIGTCLDGKWEYTHYPKSRHEQFLKHWDIATGKGKDPWGFTKRFLFSDFVKEGNN